MNKWMCAVAGLVVAASVSGCANYGAAPPTKPRTQGTPNTAPAPVPNTQRYDVNHYRNGFTAQGFNHQLAERIAKAADSVPGVEAATAAIHGTDAVIGIRTRANVAHVQQRKVIERQVHAAARKVAPNLNIRVTSDSAMFTRIRTINNTVRDGLRGAASTLTTGPNTVAGNLTNAANDFGMLIRDLGRTVTAPFR
ncbi:YhcN/YlaJ family sporulation lipoprotein [Brevibacillus thermoruber]|uniref:YhcN/YlaJ family sporulation lipoprotein n=1 Tax=Brevibacillus thermoruber TaxID=33942 RepID=UPI000691369F|nr:YhcN/YlaJ family sporulation lipoprotein [Brevibacillus thermoruber]